MKAMNDPQTIIRRAVFALLATLFFCAGVSAQEVFRRDTTLTHVYRNPMSFPIPEGTGEVDIKVRFSISEVSLAGVLFTSPSDGESIYHPVLVKVASGGGWEYALNYSPDHPFPCDRLACIPAGDYYFHFHSTGMALPQTLSLALAVDNLPGGTDTDTPVRFLPDKDAGYVPEPEYEPSYPAPTGPGRTQSRSHIVLRRMTDALGASYTDDIRYFDGVGREVQTVLVGASPDGSDLADFTDYSKRGREWRQWKPAPVQGLSGAFVSDLPERAKSFHGDSRPYTETLHAECPLDRPLVETERGDAWLEYPERYSYLCNEDHGELSCRRFSVSQTGVLMPDGLFSSGMLNVVKHTDEDGNVSYTFTDKQGRTLLERRMDGDESYDTHYVYDVSGLLRFVLPPAMDGDFSEEVQDKYAYRYVYDGLGRLTEKKLPGCSPIRYAYDTMDRVVLEQDGNGATEGKWKFMAYDALGHEVAAGVFPYAGTPPSSVPVWTKDYASAGTGTGISSTGYSTSYGYPSGTEVHTVSYYGDYGYLSLPVFTTSRDSLQYKSFAGYDTRYTADGGAYGHLTGNRVRSTSGEDLLTSYYYDSSGRVVQQVCTNHLGGYDRYLYRYDFLGNVVSSVHIHSSSGHPTLTEAYTYSYDHRERLLEVRHRLNGGNEVVLAKYTYDGLGRLESKELHGSAAETLTYSYNIRDWLTGINSDKFTQTLGYGSHYNGNISTMNWNANGSSHSYTFTYDGLNRMLDAVHGTGAYTEKVREYDKNGNIVNLQRYGNGLIDDLSYTYNGNQLTRVEDATDNTAGFSNGASAANEYTYDNNGNLTKDSNKNISGIAYNVLNLPSKVTFSDGSIIVYSYAADGTKQRTVHTISGTTTTKDYCANVVYENGVQKTLLTEEGYVDLSVSTPAYYYYLKDHQGNNRVVINGSGTVVETNHYYPFGGVFASTGNVQPYKYNGKELDTKKGLNWYDYGARHYDATLGRWFVADPLAEKHHSKSPYVYCLDNPMLYIDPLGKDTVLVQDINVRPYDRGIKGETYTAKIEVIQNGEIVGTYRGSSYPNSVSNSDNSTKWNTVKEGEYDYNNAFGHKGGTQKGLNIVNENGERVVPGKTPQGEDVEIKYANVHSGYSDLGGATSRGSTACITIHPDDASAFFSNFNWSSSNFNVGTSKGKIIIKRNIEKK